ncbi:MAG: GDYXXLXY domain-containing protein [Sphingobium sp.]
MSWMIPPRRALAASLLLPLALFAGTWATTHRKAQQGDIWLIPVQGYDPRDLLRGHFVQYRYDWPAAGGADGESLGYAPALCIIGRAPHIAAVRSDVMDHCTIVAKATMGARREVQGLDTGILYVSQPRAIALSKQLADPTLQGLLLVRIRPDGVIRPIDLQFRRRARP